MAVCSEEQHPLGSTASPLNFGVKGQEQTQEQYQPPAGPPPLPFHPQQGHQRQQAPPQQPPPGHHIHSVSPFTTHSPTNPETLSHPHNPFLSSSLSHTRLQEPSNGLNQMACQHAPDPQGSIAGSTNPFHTSQTQPPFVPSSPAPLPPPASEPPSTAFPHPQRGDNQAEASVQGRQLGGFDDKAWPTKDVIFRGQERKIVMQDENGPCSLIAISNILLLRGDIELQPRDRPLVNYDYLSSLIAEYLLTRPNDASLEQALSLLPQTQHGLNLNPGFISNETFYASSEGNAENRPSQLALFDLLGIRLYHGFLPDQSSPETLDLLVAYGSYDSAVDQVVRGDAIAEQFFREAMGDTSVVAPLKELRERGGIVLLESKGWGTALQRRNLASAVELSIFLDSNASQLTYPGLFALSALPEGTLCALFRFNHLCVLYRPVSSEIPPANEAGTNRAAPTLLTLLTDECFLDEGLAVWESLADVDGSASGEIYDGRFRRRVIDQSLGRQSGGRGRRLGGSGSGNGATVQGLQGDDAGEDADYALALQLHIEENERLEEARRRRASREPRIARPQSSAWGYPAHESDRPAEASKKTGGGGGVGGLFSTFGKGKKKDQAAATGPSGSGGGGVRADSGNGSSAGKKKNSCIVM